MTDAEPSRGSRLTRSGAAREQSNTIPDTQSNSIGKTQPAPIAAVGRKQRICDDSKYHNLEADPEELEASTAVILAAYDSSSIKNSIREAASNNANDPQSDTRSRKRLKIAAANVLSTNENRAIKPNSASFAEQRTKKEESKADVGVQANARRSRTSPQKRKVEETTIKEEEQTKKAKDSPEKSKRKRKTKEGKEAEAMPLAARSTGLRMFVGAHVSAAKGWSLIFAISYPV